MMAEGAAKGCYEPGPSFKEVKEAAMLDFSLTDSQELWLIQWPYKDKMFSISDFHGKKLSLKPHKDGNLGVLESSSGKSFDLVSFASQQPDATVFLPSESETKAGTYRKTKSRFTGFTKNHSSQGSALSHGAASVEPTPKHKKMIKDGSSLGHSNVQDKASEGSHAPGAEKSKKKVRIAE